MNLVNCGRIESRETQEKVFRCKENDWEGCLQGQM